MARIPCFAVACCGAALLALPATAAESAPAEEAAVSASPGTNWTLTARLRSRAEARFNHHFSLPAEAVAYASQPDHADLFSQQSRLGLHATRDQLSLGLTLQHTGVWGHFGGAALTAPPLFLYEGWLRYAPEPELFVEAGRFELAYGDQRVLGSVGWHQTGRAWDGVRTGWRPEGAALDLFAARYQDGGVRPLQGDAWLAGAYTTFDLDPALQALDLYALYDLRLAEPGETAVRRQLLMLGARLDGAWGAARSTAEGGVQLGRHCVPAPEDATCLAETVPLGAWFFDVEAGAILGPWRPYAAVSMASGDDPDTERFGAYDHLYPTAHAFMGYMDLIGPRTNLRELRGGVRAAHEALSLDLAVHDFLRLQPEPARVGLEVDLKVGATLQPGVTVMAGQGLFFPDQGASLTQSRPQGVASWSFVQVTAGL